MKKFVSVKAYDGTIVRIDIEKVDYFKKQQERIKALLKNGKSLDEITKLIKEGAL